MQIKTAEKLVQHTQNHVDIRRPQRRLCTEIYRQVTRHQNKNPQPINRVAGHAVVPIQMKGRYQQYLNRKRRLPKVFFVNSLAQIRFTTLYYNVYTCRIVKNYSMVHNFITCYSQRRTPREIRYSIDIFQPFIRLVQLSKRKFHTYTSISAMKSNVYLKKQGAKEFSF